MGRGRQKSPIRQFTRRMSGKDFSEVVELIVKEDPRYSKGAYFFVRKALDYTLKGLKGGGMGEKRKHVSGGQLLEGIRKYALDQFGPMAMTVFEHWSLSECSDFGEVVFNLVEYGVFGKTKSDRREDFKNGYKFKDAFIKPFLPSKNSKGGRNDS